MGAWGVVYIATNLITGEQYVGQTKQPPHVRFRAHEVSFLSRSAAASYIGVGRTAVSEAMRHNRKIAGAFTLQEVCYQL